jgi:AcrR family transcriptional regulator
MTRPPTSRAEQRQRTETRILTAARRLFAENGYDRTTIRSIAAAAGSDPGLVMRYFGSKEKLFAQAATIRADGPITGSPEQIAELLATALGEKLADEPAAALAALRSMFTHPEAGLEVRTAMSGQQQQVAALMPGEDAVLRAGLIGALTVGAVIGRHLLQLDGLHDASPTKITALLQPLISDLVQGRPTSARDRA